MKLNACLECNSAAEALGILGGDLYYAIFRTRKTSKINPRVLDPDMWIRQKEEIIKFKRELFHDGDNVFRVTVHLKEDNDCKFYPVRKEGGKNDFLYSLVDHERENFEIWINRLCGESQPIRRYYTEYGKVEDDEGELEMKYNFVEEKIGVLHLDDYNEVDEYRITNKSNHTILKMTFGLKPIPTQERAGDVEMQEVAPVEEITEIASEQRIMECVILEGYSCSCILVPEVKCKVDGFRQMAGWNAEEHLGHKAHNNFQLNTTTTNHVKVYIECPVTCTVSLWDTNGLRISTRDASANQRTYVGMTHALKYDAFDMGINAYSISIMRSTSQEGQDFPFFVQLGAPGVSSQTHGGDQHMGEGLSVKFLLNKFRDLHESNIILTNRLVS